jgi:hypothetical protein
MGGGGEGGREEGEGREKGREHREREREERGQTKNSNEAMTSGIDPNQTFYIHSLLFFVCAFII